MSCINWSWRLVRFSSCNRWTNPNLLVPSYDQRTQQAHVFMISWLLNETVFFCWCRLISFLSSPPSYPPGWPLRNEGKTYALPYSGLEHPINRGQLPASRVLLPAFHKRLQDAHEYSLSRVCWVDAWYMRRAYNLCCSLLCIWMYSLYFRYLSGTKSRSNTQKKHSQTRNLMRSHWNISYFCCL